MKKIISLVLFFSMIIGILPVSVFAEETKEQSLEDIIRPQIEAFAKSIDQPNADKKAADTIATHGMFGRGKDFKVGEDHALTATLVNSEVAKEAILKTIVGFIQTTEELDMELYNLGLCIWNVQNNHSYSLFLYDYKAEADLDVYGGDGCPDDYIKRTGYINVKKSNGYDESLEWIAGVTELNTDIEIDEIREKEIVYNLKVTIEDKFDFHTSNGSGFADLISGIGALLFKEFTWYSSFDFQIEIPNDCEHSFSDWKTAAKPNCTEKGREERTCINCGCVDTKSTAALGHSFGEWYETKAPTYFEEGEEQRSCIACGAVESRSIATLEYLLGDVSGDEKINVLDANLIRRYASKLEELSEKQLAAADTNGDGKVNVLDANLIRKFAAKLIDSFLVTE